MNKWPDREKENALPAATGKALVKQIPLHEGFDMNNSQKRADAPTEMASATRIVPFRDAQLLLVEHGGQPYVPMKPVVEGMGLAWAAQHRKLTEGRFSATITEMMMVAEDGKQRAMTCLPLRKLAGWLMSIHPNKVRQELREGIIAYQEQCDDVLWAYWNDGGASCNTTTHPIPSEPTFPASLGRWILGFDGRGKPHFTHLDAEEAVINPNRLPEIINAPYSVFDDTRLLMRIAGVTLGKLAPTAAEEADRGDIAALRSFPADVQADIEARAWRLTGQAHARIISYVAGSVALCAGHGQDVSKPAAQHRLEQITLEDALSLTAREMTMLLGMADNIAKTAVEYAEAVRKGMQALLERGMVIGPVVNAGRAA